MKKFYQTKWFIILVITLGVIVIGSSLSNTQTTPVQTYQQSVQSNNTVSTPGNQTETNTLSNDNYYTNSDGNIVHSPADSNSVPAGATARCVNGKYSFSQHRSGTCSGNGGVAEWL